MILILKSRNQQIEDSKMWKLWSQKEAEGAMGVCKLRPDWRRFQKTMVPVEFIPRERTLSKINKCPQRPIENTQIV